MNRINQESLAGRYKSFDTELPGDVRAEFVEPKRPWILERQKPARLNAGAKWPLYLVLLGCALVIGASLATWRQGQTAERVKTSKAISQPTLAPQATPTPITPMPGSASRWKAYLANNAPAPRAALVKLPPPRAQLVSLPEWKVGETRPVLMPYNLEVLATCKGRLASEEMLPSSGNALGDTWGVGDTPWVWIWAPGAARADWIDP